VERLYHPDKYKRIFCDVRIYVLNFLNRGPDAINLKYAPFIILKRSDSRLTKSARTIGG
jgi:hypothetical protein